MDGSLPTMNIDPENGAMSSGNFQPPTHSRPYLGLQEGINWMHSCIYILQCNIYIYIYIYTHTFIYKHIYIYILTCIYIYIYIHTYTYTHTHTYTYTYIYIYIYHMYVVHWLFVLSVYVDMVEKCVFVSIVFIYLSVYLPIYLSIYLSVYLPIYLSIYDQSYGEGSIVKTHWTAD